MFSDTFNVPACSEGNDFGVSLKKVFTLLKLIPGVEKTRALVETKSNPRRWTVFILPGK